MNKKGLGADTTDIAKRARITSDQAAQLKSEINSLASDVDALGKIWIGESFNEFNTSFMEQKSNLDKLTAGFDNLGEAIDKGGKSLAQTEMENASITKGIC